MQQRILKHGVMLLAAILIAKVSMGQLNLTPKISQVHDMNNEFVLVTQPNEKFDKPECAVLSGFKADDEPFDPFKIDQYPRWKIGQVMVTGEQGAERHITLYCKEDNAYLKYTPGHGLKMVPYDEYQKVWERDENFKYKSSFEERQSFYFKPEEKDKGYIRLRIPNQEGKNLVVTPPSWHTREFKLVVVKWY